MLLCKVNEAAKVDDRLLMCQRSEILQNVDRASDPPVIGDFYFREGAEREPLGLRKITDQRLNFEVSLDEVLLKSSLIVEHVIHFCTALSHDI